MPCIRTRPPARWLLANVGLARSLLRPSEDDVAADLLHMPYRKRGLE